MVRCFLYRTEDEWPVGQRGAVLLEAAFVFPIFLLIILATIDFSLLFQKHIEVRRLHYASARTAAVDPWVAGVRDPVARARADMVSRLAAIGIVITDPFAMSAGSNESTAGLVTGLHFQVTVPVRCVVCMLAPETFFYRSGTFVPMEDR